MVPGPICMDEYHKNRQSAGFWTQSMFKNRKKDSITINKRNYSSAKNYNILILLLFTIKFISMAIESVHPTCGWKQQQKKTSDRKIRQSK